ncbi:hypothetical protein DFJ74DRAFT_661798 [Hyaloraphidium curvatum]|nr:hypothetical protein DFJ74DRAFT_661798 [Hyaloraphidium curvatum]
MCHGCLVSVLPERGTTALDSGAYLVNFKGCRACGKRDLPGVRGRKLNGVEVVVRGTGQSGLGAGAGGQNGEDASNASRTDRQPNGAQDDDEEEEEEETYGEDEERTTYEHICSNCSHLIARHRHSFDLVRTGASSEEWTQEWGMECDLCGLGERSASVAVSDPQRMREAGYSMVSE